MFLMHIYRIIQRPPLGKCLKIPKIFCDSMRSRQICFRSVISSRPYWPFLFAMRYHQTILENIFECLKTKAKITKISQQSNMYISTICWTLWRSRSIAIGRNIYLESSTLYNYFVIASWLRIS